MKKRIRKTGEIVDVIAWYNLMGGERDRNDSVSYIDSKGNEYVKVGGLNLAWDFEDVEEVLSTDIDWEQRRYEIAKTVVHGQLTGPIIDGVYNKELTDTFNNWLNGNADDQTIMDYAGDCSDEPIGLFNAFKMADYLQKIGVI